jgi:hypothetical protein
MTSRTLVRLVFEGELDELDAQLRGYRSHVFAELGDGSRHAMTFFDPVRLEQDLAAESVLGRSFIAEPGLVVVPLISRANMEAAARTLAKEGFFETQPTEVSLPRVEVGSAKPGVGE